jgi:ATP-dependent helicase/nuclease subunit A
LTEPPSDAADKNQALASDPAASAWVSANAGTGKTEVLVRRVLRLLLAGSQPESILCLTYTKTAAAEMQNRLLDELASWATMPGADLRTRLKTVTGAAPDEDMLRRARALFARTLEAKGGLKIHTIHGYCERLLQRFPLEAGVSSHFDVLDERQQAELKRAAFDAVVARAAEHRDSPLGQALARIVALTTEDYFRKVVEVVLEKRLELRRMMAHHDSHDDWTAREEEALKRLFVVDDDSDGELIARMAVAMSDLDIDGAVAAFTRSGETSDDTRTEAGLRAARNAAGESRALALADAFMTEGRKPKSRVFSKAFAAAEPATARLLLDVRERFAALDLKRAHLLLAEASGALIALADAIRSEYEARKQVEAALDYDDLIDKAQGLLLRSGAAAWVLYKIDGGIDHILVDEAQDTNPAQWNIVEKLAEEFFAGAGTSGKLRTLFAVGDEKQSIYSFQGAAPTKFGEMGRAFRAKVRALGLTWNDVPLNISFRSTPFILEAVDTVFARPPAANGVLFGAAALKHYPYRKGQAGLVELWEVEVDTDAAAAGAFEPWSEERSGARSVDALCARIAGLIKHWLASKEQLPALGQEIKAGDVLILVRRRDPFTAPMFRALKRQQVPVAGADRMRLMDQLAVQDLMALADVLLMPEDDLALAVVLKSPLFGLTDDDLFTLAHARPGSLWVALRNKAGTDPRFGEAFAALSDWLARVYFVPPYEFYSELLGKDGQVLRKRFLARLGPEAAEALDEFLDRALAYDREEAPSLQGFAESLRLSDVEIKRDMDQDRDEVRIMTVHGAKGLQAPIVFLPDTCTGPRAQGPRLYPVPRSDEPPDTVTHLVWAPKGHSSLGVLDATKNALKCADWEEYHRLLYVAMTRARDRLYIAGWQGGKKRENGSWHDLVDASLQFDKAEGHGGRPVRRLESRQEVAPTGQAKAASKATGEPPELPRWATTQAATERPRFVLMPSRLVAASSPAPEGAGEQPPLGPRALAENRRFSRGRLVHTLLQYLPEVSPANRLRAAETFVALRGADLPAEMREEIVHESLAIVEDARFAPLFAPGSLGEVPVVARIGVGEQARELSGQIDRLAILDDALLILDYKTNRPPPQEPGEVAEAYVAQLAAYRMALRDMFPDRALRAAIVWTDGPKLMEIPSTLLDDAERRILGRGPSLDVAGTRT